MRGFESRVRQEVFPKDGDCEEGGKGGYGVKEARKEGKKIIFFIFRAHRWRCKYFFFLQGIPVYQFSPVESL